MAYVDYKIMAMLHASVVYSPLCYMLNIRNICVGCHDLYHACHMSVSPMPAQCRCST